MQNLRAFLFFSLAFILLRCTLEEASVPEQRELVIASDYLSEADSILFERFERKERINVRIVHLDAQIIYDQLLNEGSQSEIDIIMLESEFDVHRMAISDLLQPWPSEFKVSGYLEKYASKRYHYIGFGLDPYIVTASKGSIPFRSYSDFTQHPFSDELARTDRINLLSPICKKLDRGRTENWIKNFMEHGREPTSAKDSIIITLPRLMKRSTYYDLKSNSPSSLFPEMRILTSGKSGSFYNLRTFSTASQCSNYTEAITFVKHFLQTEQNQYLCSKLNLVPVTNPGEFFRPYKINTEELLSNHTLVERILTRFGIQ